jgi:hypothetical protein
MEATHPAANDSTSTLDAATIRIFLLAALLTILGDFLLWPAPPLFSLGLFAIASCTAILLGFGRTRSSVIGFLLLCATAIQTGIEISFSNVLVMLLLLGIVLGEASYPRVRARWLRWTEGILSLVRLPTAWGWAGPILKQLPRKPENAEQYMAILIQVGLPTLAAAIVFALLLGNGNAIFAQWISEALTSGLNLIPHFSPGRVVLWLLLATFSLGILRPTVPILSEQTAMQVIPTFNEPRDLRLARWRTLSILGALNALFFAVNTIDGFYLWIHQKLPEGIGYSDFVHQGVHSLVVAVLLSAAVLTAVYQQRQIVIAPRAVRILAFVWIAQNVVLIAGVLMRLKLYVDAYQLSEQRVYVAIFLLLVAVGFGLLAHRIVAEKSLLWTILANGLTAFGLFFTVQFLDVARWVADYNVARWQGNHTRVLDVEYLASLGHSAYPALIRVAETSGRSEAHTAFAHLQVRKEIERARMDQQDWRSLQIRQDSNARRLLQHEIRTRR